MPCSSREFFQSFQMTSRRNRTLRALRASLLSGAFALLSTGCITMAGNQLPDIEPRSPGVPPVTIEQTVGNFSFHLDGGKLVTSNKMGRLVNKQILDRWKKRGFITRETYVKSSNFTGNADYNLTLSGHQEGESSVVMQILSGLTLYLIPNSVNTHLDLVYTLQAATGGRVYEAKASDSYRTVQQLFLLPITPFAMGGSMRTHNRLADHLFDQFAEQGAFDPENQPTAPSGALSATEEIDVDQEEVLGTRTAVERLRVMNQLHKNGAVSDEEYERKKIEILRDL